jgi:hypothetical protein
MRTKFACLLSLLLALALPASASADGLPVPVEDTGPSGIADRVGVYRYVSLDIGGRTLVERTVQNGGAVSDSRTIGGEYTIPAVGIDGSPSGLSADGKTLVLITPRPSFPRKTTELAVLETKQLDIRDRIRLDGDFSFDAISPDGRTMYLIHYLSPRDYTQYEVRAYDLEQGHLVPGAITDPNEDPDEMLGTPISRETSPSGRWAYTLYAGGKHPFVHALDTEHGTAVCVDLDDLRSPRDYRALGLDPGAGPSLTVTLRGEAAAIVDTRTFEVSRPTATEPAPAIGPDPDDGSPVGIWALAAGAGLLACALALVFRRRRGGPVSGEPAL